VSVVAVVDVVVVLVLEVVVVALERVVVRVGRGVVWMRGVVDVVCRPVVGCSGCSGRAWWAARSFGILTWKPAAGWRWSAERPWVVSAAREVVRWDGAPAAMAGACALAPAPLAPWPCESVAD
jgi:hypothetical protein